MSKVECIGASVLFGACAVATVLVVGRLTRWIKLSDPAVGYTVGSLIAAPAALAVCIAVKDKRDRVAGAALAAAFVTLSLLFFLSTRGSERSFISTKAACWMGLMPLTTTTALGLFLIGVPSAKPRPISKQQGR